MVKKKGYQNRSLALGDMIRAQLIEYQQDVEEGEVVGTITLVYDHHQQRIQKTLTELQHRHLDAIISSLHVHLNHDNCLEVLVVRGEAKQIRNVADHLISAKGVKHGKLTLTTTGKEVP